MDNISSKSPSMGYFKSGLPFNRFGNGPRPLIIFAGLSVENKPLAGLRLALLKPFKPLGTDYTVYAVNRRPGIPEGYTLADMAKDYATTIREELESPVDVIGVSLGGLIAQVFAADHPDLVRRLVVYKAACRLSSESRPIINRWADLAKERRWREVFTGLLETTLLRRRGLGKYATLPISTFVWLLVFMFSKLSRRRLDPSDFVAAIEAELKFDFCSRLDEIKAPTLVIGGGRDPFFPKELLEETAVGIPGARLIVHPKAGHIPSGKQAGRDIHAFLKEGSP